MLLGLGAALGAAVVFGVATVLQALGARRVPGATGLDLRLLPRLLREPAILAALALNFVGFVLHLVAIRTLPLYLAQAGIAASLVVTASLAIRMFDDRLTRGQWGAVAAVPVGLAVLAAAAGQKGQGPGAGAYTVGLFVAVGVIAVAGWLCGRSGHPVVPAVLGLLAGLAFAADSVAIRLLPGFSPLDLWRAAPTYAFLASASLGFLLYSTALQRGAVTAATAPMIVAQTAAPAVVGVLLGDDVRPGYLPAAAFGLMLTTVGTARLARFEGSRGASSRADTDTG